MPCRSKKETPVSGDNGASAPVDPQCNLLPFEGATEPIDRPPVLSATAIPCTGAGLTVAGSANQRGSQRERNFVERITRAQFCAYVETMVSSARYRRNPWSPMSRFARSHFVKRRRSFCPPPAWAKLTAADAQVRGAAQSGFAKGFAPR
jgi:hypothetical protein